MPVLPISRRQALFLAAALAVLLFLGGKLLIGAGTSGSVSPVPFSSTAISRAVAPRLVVDVVGAVSRPGLYRLKDGSRVADAVSRAGGPTAKANLDGLNLAAPLADGEQVLVPPKTAATVPAGEPGSPGGSAAAPAGPISLSTATLEQLDALPGVGPVTAQKILDYRAAHGAFKSVDELDAVSGIGPARLDELRGLVVP